MAKIPKFTIEYSIDDETPTLAKKVLTDLKRRGLYRPDLMYRGVSVDDDKLKKISKYGTDRDPINLERKIEDQLLHLVPLTRPSKKSGSIFTPEEAIKLARENVSPELAWALPERRLSRCIDRYAFEDLDLTPVLLVYNPDCLLYYGTGYEKDTGKELKKISRKLMLDEEKAFYRFKEGVKPRDAIVAIYILKPV